MKRIILFVFLFCNSSAFAQDIIYFKDGTEVLAIVLDITPNTVIYKRYSNPDGPKYEEYKKRISYIRYSSGIVEKYDVDPLMIQVDSNKAILHSRQGSYLGAWGCAGAASVEDLHDNATACFSYTSALLYKYIIGKYVGFVTGVGYMSLHSSIETSDYTENGITERADVYIKTYSFPTMMSIVTGKPDNLNFNPEAGIIFSGTFSDTQVRASTGETIKHPSGFMATFYASLNLSIPVSKKVNITAGPFVTQSMGSKNFVSAFYGGGNLKLWYKF